MVGYIIKIILSYLLGSVSGSLIAGKFKGVDIRKMGSGNAGGTNAFRTQGAGFAAVVILIDVAKGFIATVYVAYLTIPFITGPDPAHINLLLILCGVAAVVGHVYPVYFGFKGGKGAGAAIGVVLAIAPTILLIAVFIWIINLVITGFVGLGTIIAAVSIPVMSIFLSVDNIYFPYFAFPLAVFIIYTHRSNIKRMIEGNENRFEKARIFHRAKNS